MLTVCWCVFYLTILIHVQVIKSPTCQVIRIYCFLVRMTRSEKVHHSWTNSTFEFEIRHSRAFEFECSNIHECHSWHHYLHCILLLNIHHKILGDHHQVIHLKYTDKSKLMYIDIHCLLHILFRMNYNQIMDILFLLIDIHILCLIYYKINDIKICVCLANICILSLRTFIYICTFVYLLYNLFWECQLIHH